MILFSKYPYTFKRPNSDETFNVTQGTRCPAPEWVKDLELFQMAVQNGRIQIMKPKESEEAGAELEALRDRAKELKISGYAKMTPEELRAAIAEKEQATGSIGE